MADGPVGGSKRDASVGLSKREASGGGVLDVFDVPLTDEFLDRDFVPFAFAWAGAREM
jgi:hypothetical protein